jgi:hypothetical protein
MATRLFSPTFDIVPQLGDVLGKNLKKFFAAQNPSSAEKGQKSSTPLISLGEIHFHHHENHP